MTGKTLYRFSGIVANSYFQLNTLTFPVIDATEEEIVYKDKYVVIHDEKYVCSSMTKDKLLKGRTLSSTDHEDLSNYFIYCDAMDTELAIEMLTRKFREVILERRSRIDNQLFYLEDYINDYVI